MGRHKPKGKCFHYGVEGQWKRNYNKYLSKLKDKKKGKYDLLISEACLVEDDLSPWIVDSGATNHFVVLCRCLVLRGNLLIGTLL